MFFATELKDQKGLLTLDGVGRDKSFGVAQRSGDRVTMGRDFPHPSRLALGPTQSPIGAVGTDCLSWG
jgi:hypothetical protein